MTSFTIYNADSRSLQEIEDNTIDLVVTSPPYYNVREYGTGHEKGEIGKSTYKQYLDDMQKVFEECYRVLKDSRFMCINISNILVETETVPIPYDYFNIIRNIEGLTFEENIFWRKPEGTTNMTRAGSFMQRPYPRRIKLNRLEEFIFIFRKGSQDLNETYQSDEIIKESKVKVKQELLSNMWYFPCASATREHHPAPYPIDLPYRCILLYTYKGETVLDPFNGSGTSGLACKQLGRNYIGYEINPEHIETSKKKIGFGESSLFGDEYNYKIVKRCEI